MIDRISLLNDLRRQLKRLEVDLGEQADRREDLSLALKTEYQVAREAERVGESFNAWRGGVLTQAAVAWLLGCVFVRFAEDNGLVEEALIAGPGERNTRAADRQTLYFRVHPTDSDRDYLLDVFATVSKLPGMTRLYDREHNPVWRYPISGDMARDILAFWRAVDPDSGVLRHDFADPDWDTRFLGDLYQDLSVEAKKRYALLQTPEFVEEFILDRTLTPALDEFGLAGTRLIDPACGSGHFLLGAFARLLRAWFDREPGTPERTLVQRALDGVYGVDINPFAAAIAQFRLLAAALRASRIERLKEAPNFRLNVAAGDSLLHGRRFHELDVGSGAEQLKEHERFDHAFRIEDLDELNRILGQQYHVVVGNPPYVTVKDAAVNRLYRARYGACHMKYALSVPFTERFFDLAMRGSATQSAGHVGQITSNSFMKREFGRKLIEEFVPSVDLTHVIDTSGAYIPGHGTPTVILLGRNRRASADSIRAVLGIRGEPGTPADPATANVWTAVVTQVDLPGSESEWVNIHDISRKFFHRHPWNLSDGDANDLFHIVSKTGFSKLADAIDVVGVFGMTNADGVMLASSTAWRRRKVEMEFVRPVCVGDEIRDWMLRTGTFVSFPYSTELKLIMPDAAPNLLAWLWPYRTILGSRATFSKLTYFQEGRPWYEWHQVALDRLRVPLSITFSEVATHNHFVLDRGGKVFKQTAPVIKLPADATEADHLVLVGLLNSSVACFWMKQVCHNKGSTVDAHGARQTTDAFENFYAYNGSRLKQFPIAPARPSSLKGAVGSVIPTRQTPQPAPSDRVASEGKTLSILSAKLDRLAVERQAHLPARLADRFPMAPAELDVHRCTAADLLARMIALQEELDWECYRLYGVIDKDCCYAGEEPPAPERPPGSQPVQADQCSDDGVPRRVGKVPGHPRGVYPNMVSRQESGATPRHADETNHRAERSSHPDLPASGDHRNLNDAGDRREPPPLALGERAFEIVMARRMEADDLETTWFARHGSAPITELPAQWPAEYRILVERRIELIETDRFIGLLEKPEYKRRWNVEPWDNQERRALRSWMLDRLESPAYWPEKRLATVRTLAELAAKDADFQQLAARYAGHAGVDLENLVVELVESENVPALPVQRYKPTGLTKRADWERTWALQRREDEIDAEVAASTLRREDEAEDD